MEFYKEVEKVELSTVLPNVAKFTYADKTVYLNMHKVLDGNDHYFHYSGESFTHLIMKIITKSIPFTYDWMLHAEFAVEVVGNGIGIIRKNRYGSRDVVGDLVLINNDAEGDE